VFFGSLFPICSRFVPSLLGKRLELDKITG
jgi:hypothetical protein